MLTGDAGQTLTLAARPGPWRLQAEDGTTSSGTAAGRDGHASLTLPREPGYYRLEIDGREITVAVAPTRCFTVADAFAAPGQDRGQPPRGWGLAQQLYALRRPGDGGVGDFTALAEFAREAASQGACAITISPVHAQFSADPDRFSPYAPSSRIMLNVLHIAAGDPGEEAARLEALELVDWPGVGRDRLSRLRSTFEAGGDDDAAFQAWRASEGDKLEFHALFEALHAELWRARGGAWNWKDWPAEFRDPHAAGAQAFAQANGREIAFHAWLQHRADGELAAAQQAALDAGMAIGLISDLAVGADSGGSHSWSRQGETLVGLTVGAPPDLLQRDGQNWGITAFSARGLRANGYRAFIEMLTGAMRHAGGVRIDHAMGLNRLWIVPEGRSAAQGVYMQMPETDLARLVRLESVRNRAIVLGEDLGTVPDGFQERLQQDGIDGMRVLWFERDKTSFTAPSKWTQQASAMTSTHDLPTVAGWWKGVDIRHKLELGGTEAEEHAALAERAADRTALWQAMLDAGAACGLGHRAGGGCRGGAGRPFGVRAGDDSHRGCDRTGRAAEHPGHHRRASQLAPPAARAGRRRAVGRADDAAPAPPGAASPRMTRRRLDRLALAHGDLHPAVKPVPGRQAYDLQTCCLKTDPGMRRSMWPTPGPRP